jgi:pyruvate dehydrogenase E2 component (dihydrolipoamide acetyltransferase)
MAGEIRIPRLGWSMEEGTFVGWLKQDGDPVQVGDALYELEGEKATQDIEATDAGILRIPPDAPPPGTVMPVGALLAYVLADGEAPPWLAEPATTSGTGSRDSPRVAGLQSTSPSQPIAESRLAAGHHADSQSHGVTKSSPRARRVATELGIDWTRLAGTGRHGRVREADVRRAADQRGDKPSSPQPGIKEFSARRKTIADRMRISRERTVPLTLTTIADATNFVGLRNQFKTLTQTAPAPTYTDIVACVAATVLKQHPLLAARWRDEETLIVPADDRFDIGVAVDTPDGLLVPVIRDVGRLSPAEIAARSRDLADRARAGELALSEMQGGMFTITNLGAFGIDAFTPVINYPEVAILGLGAIRREAVVQPDGTLAARDRITLSLTFDHRALDGAPAAAFLRDLRTALENPAALLLRG